MMWRPLGHTECFQCNLGACGMRSLLVQRGMDIPRGAFWNVWVHHSRRMDKSRAYGDVCVCVVCVCVCVRVYVRLCVCVCAFLMRSRMYVLVCVRSAGA